MDQQLEKRKVLLAIQIKKYIRPCGPGRPEVAVELPGKPGRPRRPRSPSRKDC